MISEASPIGVSRSAKKSTAFAPGSRQPMRMHEPSCALRHAHRAAAADDDAAMIAPAARNRVDAPSSGGTVSTTTAIARYVEPQMM